MVAEIDHISVDELSRTDVDQLASNLTAEYQVDCPVLGEDIMRGLLTGCWRE